MPMQGGAAEYEHQRVVDGLKAELAAERKRLQAMAAAPSTVHLILDGDFDSFDKETKSNHMTADIAAALKLDPVRISIGECMAGSIIAQVVVIVCSV